MSTSIQSITQFDRKTLECKMKHFNLISVKIEVEEIVFAENQIKPKKPCQRWLAEILNVQEKTSCFQQKLTTPVFYSNVVYTRVEIPMASTSVKRRSLPLPAQKATNRLSLPDMEKIQPARVARPLSRKSFCVFGGREALSDDVIASLRQEQEQELQGILSRSRNSRRIARDGDFLVVRFKTGLRMTEGGVQQVREVKIKIGSPIYFKLLELI